MTDLTHAAALLADQPSTGIATPAPGFMALVREDLNCVFARDPAARSLWEVATTYPGVHAIVVHRFSHAMWQRGWRYPARFLSFLGRTLTNVDIHPGARIGRSFFIDHGAGVVIGETAEVGSDVTLYHGVTLGGTSWNKGKRHPTLEDGVVVGAGAKILGPITVGTRSRVGANSVVVKNTPPDCTVVGVPGRVIPRRAQITLTNGPGKPGELAGPEGSIALDHNVMPDPVAKSIQCMLNRIDTLERELHDLRAQRGEAPISNAAGCGICTAGELCCDHPREE